MGNVKTEIEEKPKKTTPTKSKQDKEKKKDKEIKVDPAKPEKPELEKKEEEDEEDEFEGQLAIDVYETDGDIVIQSTIGGIKADDLDISIEGDMVSIRGSRESKAEKKGEKYFYQECFWGSFSRKVILPEEVDGSKAKALMEDGVLTLTMPKLHRKQKRKITVKQAE